MAAVGVGRDELVGRGKHLASLAQVFRHRHGTWADFGLFLKQLFGEGQGTTSAVTAPSQVPCRHNHGGRHHALLRASIEEPLSYTMFDHERYRRPCVSIGSFDINKNPGLVVTDLCVKANRFLLSIGKGDEAGPAGKDCEYVQSLEPISSPVTASRSEDTDDFMDIDPSNILDSRLRSPRDERAGETQVSDSQYSNEFFEDEDVQEELSALAQTFDSDVRGVQSPSETMETLSDVGTGDSVLASVDGRLSTKMRAATLGYLWKFADEPAKLREEFRKLRRESNLQVLHLCGCGLCLLTNEGSRVFGCCEKSHLILGTAVMNGHHKTYHEVIGRCLDTDYAQLCGIIHRGRDGKGLF